MITARFLQMVQRDRPYTVAQWAEAMNLDRYKFCPPRVFARLSGTPLHMIVKESPHESKQAPGRHRPRRRDAGRNP
ncbi:hypothetical protein [Cobetia marina]|uniref:hypothetical protein n=1 Tax=Cobetia marina TaxID=28258 RepID=UPI001142BA3D|nr:hypothetical protein [Cobetia marina]GED41199.1 hypothetical protein HHA02_05280 [Cobetia marina]